MDWILPSRRIIYFLDLLIAQREQSRLVMIKVSLIIEHIKSYTRDVYKSDKAKIIVESYSYKKIIEVCSDFVIEKTLLQHNTEEIGQ